MQIIPQTDKQQSNQPSKFIMVLALLFAFALPYILVKYFSHHKKYTHLALDLPVVQESVINQEPEENSESPPAKDNEWQIVQPRPGDSMGAIFQRLGLTAKSLHAVLDKNPHAKVLTNIKPGQQLQFLISHNELKQLLIPINDRETLSISLEKGHYASKIIKQKTTTQSDYVAGLVQGSLFNTAKKLNIPFNLMRQMTTILNKQIDFSRAIRAGDKFAFVYDAYYIDDKKVGTGDILAVSYTNRGKTYQAIKHTNKQGEQDYYTPEGNSLKKAFSRYPLRFSHISSTFALSRYHAILHYRRPHKGIDLAAPIGTPIRATGSGVIQIIGRQNGYGNMVKIKHDKTYSTVYGHMLRFQKGLSKGSHVSRDQVIGYVGQTGLATGPHCHYELHVRNQPRNPTTTPLPTAAPIYGRELAAFKTKARTLFARLKLIQEAKLAASNKLNT